MKPDIDPIKLAVAGVCPACRRGALFKHPYIGLAVNERCAVCDFPLGNNDSADGPSVLLMFILSAVLVPLALVIEFSFGPPLWFHIIVWGGLAVTLALGGLRPLKAYVIALQYKHRPGAMQDHDKK